MAVLRLSAASPQVLPQARDFIRQQMLELGMDGRTDDAVLAVNEAVSNTVRHAYPDTGGDVEIIVEPTEPGALVTIRDAGRGPHTWRGHGGGGWGDTDGGGLGGTIMAASSDSFHVAGEPRGGTTVSLHFHR